MDQANVEKELSRYIGRILRNHFGRGPGTVFVTVADPFITVYFTNFLSPTERSLLHSEQAELRARRKNKRSANGFAKRRNRGLFGVQSRNRHSGLLL